MDGVPTWFLDVDGVINADDAGWGAPPRRGRARADGVEWEITWEPRLIDRLAALHKNGIVKLMWCSTWCAYADELERLFGLPPLPRAFSEPWLGRQCQSAKASAVLVALALGHRVIWTDDTEVPMHRGHLQRYVMDGQALLIAPDGDRGLRPEHLVEIEKWVQEV